MATKKKKNKGGRPTKKTKEIVQKLVDAFKRDYTVEEACSYAGIGKVAFYDWLKKDEKFANEIEAAKYYLLQAAKNTIAAKIANEKDDELSKWFLERRAKKLYSLRQEITGEDGEALKIEWNETKTYDETKQETNNSD